MKVTILGSGTGVPRLERGAPGYFLQFGNNTALLDSGPGTLQRLLAVGGDYRFLDALFYTHTHPDHITDFIPLLFALKYTPGFQRKTPLRVFGSPVLRDYFRRAVHLHGDWLKELPFDLIWTIDKKEFTFGSMQVQTAEMNHSVPTVGYRLTADSGLSLVFSGDTDVTPSLISLARNADWALFECSFPDDQKIEGHLTPTEAAKIASAAGVKNLILTHLYAPCDAADPISVCRSHFSGSVQLARDGMVLEI